MLRAHGAFYDPLMRIVGLELERNDTTSVHYGNAVGILFSLETPVDKRPATPGNGVNVAFAASDRQIVDHLYWEAQRLGGRDAGPPGPALLCLRERSAT